MAPPLLRFGLLLVCSAASVLAQGPLTPPPGPPAPTQRSLGQIEPRTPISVLPVTLNASGSYYLTGNLSVTTAGITIAADGVTLDLNGFTISSAASPPAGTAILISGARRSVTVRNGGIQGTTTFNGTAFPTGGFLSGVLSNNATSSGLRVADLRVGGVGDGGIDLALVSANPRNAVERCSVSVSGGLGIRAAVIRDCEADTAGSDAIVGNVISRCFGQSVGTSTNNDGIAGFESVSDCQGIAIAGLGVNGGSVVSNSSGRSDTNTGLDGAAVSNSRGSSTSGIGLRATESATNCAGVSTSNTGLSTLVAQNCSGSSTSGTAGLLATGTAANCRGSRDGGVAINAGIAIACSVTGSGTITAASKFLGTP